MSQNRSSQLHSRAVEHAGDDKAGYDSAVLNQMEGYHWVLGKFDLPDEEARECYDKTEDQSHDVLCFFPLIGDSASSGRRRPDLQVRETQYIQESVQRL